MAFDRFLIAPFNTGLQNNIRPWLIPEDAFERLENAYVFRGRVRKRFGSTFMVPEGFPEQSRLRVNIGTTDGAGNFAGIVPGAVFEIGQAFSVATDLFTVIATGNPAAMLSNGTGAGTYDTTTGAVTIIGAPALTIVFFYPSQPVMGFANYEVGPINNQPSFAFDTQFAYEFTPSVGWNRSQSGGNPVFHGSDLNFFWTVNWEGSASNDVAMFTTNFNVTNPNGAPTASDDPIWSFTRPTWTNFSPVTIFTTTGQYVQTCRLIMPFYNRLILLNTIETTDAVPTAYTSHPNRARFSFNGSPFATNAWLEPNQTTGGLFGAGAGFIDAATEEQIITAEFIKDRLIVFFERSTWEIVYTGNEIQPFRWQKINTELGAESQNSAVPFDTEILAIANVGVHACNGANVQRIDEKIPDEIFDISNKNIGVQRVAGIRDYYVECVYWSFPSTVNTDVDEFPYPNKVLLYNYRNKTWAFNDDCITAFGYFEQQQARTWASWTGTWEESTTPWADLGGAVQAQFRQIVAGNQEGFTFLITPDETRNAPVMQLTNVSIDVTTRLVTLTIINHTLHVGDAITLEEFVPTTFVAPNVIYPVVDVIDADTVVIQDRNTPNAFISGAYVGGTVIARVSQINILSKQWNPYNSPQAQEARDFYLHKIDFGVKKTANGKITVDYFPSSTFVSMLDDGDQTDTLMGTGVLETFPYSAALYPLEQFQERLWHALFFQTDGNCIQIFLTMRLTSDQLLLPAVAFSDFQLEGMALMCSRTRSRLE